MSVARLGLLVAAIGWITCSMASAADLGLRRHHHWKSHRQVVESCRTGWWQHYRDDHPYPRWGTRCAYRTAGLVEE